MWGYVTLGNICWGNVFVFKYIFLQWDTNNHLKPFVAIRAPSPQYLFTMALTICAMIQNPQSPNKQGYNKNLMGFKTITLSEKKGSKWNPVVLKGSYTNL